MGIVVMTLELVLACETIGAAVLAADVGTGKYLDIGIGAMLGGAMPEEIHPPLGAGIAPFDVAMIFLCTRSINDFEMASFVGITFSTRAARDSNIAIRLIPIIKFKSSSTP